MRTRESLLDEALYLVNKNKAVILQWATGVGKSKAAIEMANCIIKSNINRKLEILIVVAESAHKNNWLKEISKWRLADCNLSIECYASITKCIDTKWDLVIFDEAHHLNSDLKIRALLTMKMDHVFLLSATLPESLIELIQAFKGKIGISTITLEEAINNNIVPKPKVYMIPLELDNDKSTETIEKNWGKKIKRKVINCEYKDRWTYISHKDKYPDVTLRISCTQKEKYEDISNSVEYWKRTFFMMSSDVYKNKWLRACLDRKIFLGECKTDKVKVLIEKLKSKRFICFCTNIEQAENLGNENSIHSKKLGAGTTISKFDKGEIDNLFLVGMLREGQNLNKVEASIMIQLDSKELLFIQKFGRGLRAEDPVQFIFYYKDTRDEEYAEKVYDYVGEEYVKLLENFEELRL